jgi:hypothetical protein
MENVDTVTGLGCSTSFAGPLSVGLISAMWVTPEGVEHQGRYLVEMPFDIRNLPVVWRCRSCGRPIRGEETQTFHQLLFGYLTLIDFAERPKAWALSTPAYVPLTSESVMQAGFEGRSGI